MNWTELLYQYGLGGLFFFVTLFLALRFRAAEMSLPGDRTAVWVSLGGFFLYLLLNSAWILAVSP